MSDIGWRERSEDGDDNESKEETWVHDWRGEIKDELRYKRYT